MQKEKLKMLFHYDLYLLSYWMYSLDEGHLSVDLKLLSEYFVLFISRLNHNMFDNGIYIEFKLKIYNY